MAFVYKWTHLPTMKWYIGSRTAKKSHLDDGYICSSRYVKPLIESTNNEWKRDIIATGTAEEMIKLESEILEIVDAKNDPQSFNKHNGDGKFSVTGKKFGPQSDSHKSKLSASKKGRVAWNKGVIGFKHSEESKKAIGLSRKGKSWDEKTKLKISLSEKRTKEINKYKKVSINLNKENQIC
jgi:hypothetical protein